MSDATSGFKSARTQSGRQSKDYENTTHLRMGRRPGLEPVGAGIGWDVRDCSVLFWADGLKRSPRASALRSGPSVVAFGRRASPNTMAASTHTAVDSQQHSIQTDDTRLTTMQCPVDGTQLSDRHRDGDRVECPACRGRFDVAEVIVHV